MSERHIDLLCAALNCKRPEPDTFREWGLRMANFGDGELDRICGWIADNWEMSRFPPVSQLHKAAGLLGIYHGRGVVRAFDATGQKCDRCNGYGLVRVAGEIAAKDGKQITRVLQEKPFDVGFDEDGGPLLRAPDPSALRYERLECCDCPAGTAKAGKLTDDKRRAKVAGRRP